MNNGPTNPAADGAAGMTVAGTNDPDVLNGGAGPDSIAGFNGADTINGNDGDDSLFGGPGQDSLFGGNGDDVLFSSTDADVLNGGAGNDRFDMTQCAVITGGPGVNTILVEQKYDLTAPMIVTDFHPGLGGDQIDITQFLFATGPTSFIGDHSLKTNPFTAGEARLVDDGNDTLLQVAPPGGADYYVGYTGASTWVTLIRFVGVSSSQLTADNFTPGVTTGSLSSPTPAVSIVFDPHATDPNGPQSIDGNSGNDTLIGGVGNDLIRGMGGADSINGGDGDDPHVNGNMGDDVVHGGAGNDTVYGGQGNDTIYGDAGNDRMSGDLGDDVIYGGPGADRFVFAPGSGHDWIADFNSAEGDRIVLPLGTSVTLTTFQNQVVIGFGDGDTIGLAGVSMAQLGDWVVFA